MNKKGFARGQQLFLNKSGKRQAVVFIETLKSGANTIINENGKIELAYDFELEYAPPIVQEAKSKKSAL